MKVENVYVRRDERTGFDTAKINGEEVFDITTAGIVIDAGEEAIVILQALEGSDYDFSGPFKLTIEVEVESLNDTGWVSE